MEVPPPVVVLAPARSGSSVVVAMLGVHPQMYGFPELKLFAHESIAEVLDARPRLSALQGASIPWDPASGLRRAISEVLFGCQDAPAMARAGQWLEDRRDWRTREVLGLLLASVAPLVGVEKSPETTFDAAGPARALEWYPSARFIHLVRHPVAFQRSLQKMLLLFDRPDVCAKAWLTSHRRIAAFCAALPPGQAMVVRLEDMLAASDPHLAAVTGFIGVSSDEASLAPMRHPERSPFSVGVSDAAPHWDPGFLASPTLRPPVLPATVRAPHEWGIPQALEEEIAVMADGFGYSDDEGSDDVEFER